jgi:hypothetical protein
MSPAASCRALPYIRDVRETPLYGDGTVGVIDLI